MSRLSINDLSSLTSRLWREKNEGLLLFENEETKDLIRVVRDLKTGHLVTRDERRRTDAKMSELLLDQLDEKRLELWLIDASGDLPTRGRRIVLAR